MDEEPVEPATWYLDADGDGVGTPSDSIAGCPAPDGYVATAGDCDDDDPTRAPSLPEVCENGIDDDCSGADARCGSSGIHSLPEADVKIVGDLPERELGGMLAVGPDCVAAGTGSLLMFQDDTNGRDNSNSGEIPSAWTALAGADVHSQTLPASGRVLTTGTDTGLVVRDAAACLAGIGPGGARAVLVSAEPNDSDLDGDGLGDIVVARAGGDSSAGAAYLFYSGSLAAGTTSALDADATWIADGAADNASQLAGGADLDGDGFDDLAIGAYGDDTNGEDAGAVYVIVGGLH